MAEAAQEVRQRAKIGAKVVTGGMGPSFAQAVQWLALWMGLVLLTNLIQVVSGRASNALWSKMR